MREPISPHLTISDGAAILRRLVGAALGVVPRTSEPHAGEAVLGMTRMTAVAVRYLGAGLVERAYDTADDEAHERVAAAARHMDTAAAMLAAAVARIEAAEALMSAAKS